MSPFFKTFLSCLLAIGLVYCASSHSEDAPTPPKAVLLVLNCSKIVAAWVVDSADKIERFDSGNPPKDIPAWKKWVLTAAIKDEVIVPCAGPADNQLTTTYLEKANY